MRRLSDIEAFVHVVEDGGFSAASRNLGISRSYTSKLVAELEARLGVRLLHRTTRSVRLTEAGRRFHEACSPLLEGIEEAEDQAITEQVEPRGTLRVAAPLAFGVRYLAGVFTDFQILNPHVDLRVEYSDDFVDIVAMGHDVAIRGGDLEDSALVGRRLLPFRILAAASPAYLEQRGPPESPEDLGRHACLLYSPHRNPNRWWFTGAGGEQTVTVRGPLQANNADAILVAARAGLGVVYQPEWALAPDLAAGTLRRVLPEHEGREGSFWAIYPHRRHVPAKVRHFIDHLVEAFATPPWSAGA